MSKYSANVEILGGSLMVQHYVEEIAKPDHLKLVSNSDVIAPDRPPKDRRDLGFER
jgi:hypothetical protein